MEQIFLDQSQPAPGASARRAAAPRPVAPAASPVVATPAPAARAGRRVQLQPRVSNNQITGLIVSPGGDGGQAFRAAGFAPGDVIVAVNGQRVNSAEQALGAGPASGRRRRPSPSIAAAARCRCA